MFKVGDKSDSQQMITASVEAKSPSHPLSRDWQPEVGFSPVNSFGSDL
jgi:hypothetical protein